jgi:hypothetical protein
MPSGKQSLPASSATPGGAGPAGSEQAAAAAGAPALDPKIINRVIMSEHYN